MDQDIRTGIISTVAGRDKMKVGDLSLTYI